MNKLTIIGNLTSDPASHVTGEGKDVCNFSVAVNRRKKVQGQPEADFFRVAAWGALAGPCQKYLTKGRKVCVVGSVSVSTYQAQDGSTRANMEVYANEVEFLSSGNGSGQETTQEQAPAAAPQPTPVDVSTEELPF